MLVPDFQSCMLPLLKAISDGTEKEYKSVKKQLAEEFRLTEDELLLMIPSGRSYLFDNRLGWANTYLKKAGLIASGRKGYLQITKTGQELLKSGIQNKLHSQEASVENHSQPERLRFTIRCLSFHYYAGRQHAFVSDSCTG